VKKKCLKILWVYTDTYHMKTLNFIFDSNFCIMQHHVFASLWIKDHSDYVRWNIN